MPTFPSRITPSASRRYPQELPHPSNHLCLSVNVDIMWSARQQERVGGITFLKPRNCPSMPSNNRSPRVIEFGFLGGIQVPVPGLPCCSCEWSEDAEPRRRDARPVRWWSRSDAGIDLGRDPIRGRGIHDRSIGGKTHPQAE